MQPVQCGIPTAPVVQMGAQGGPQTVQVNVCAGSQNTMQQQHATTQKPVQNNAVAAANYCTEDELEYEAFEERFEEQKSSCSMMTVMIGLLFVLVLAMGGYGVYAYMVNPKQTFKNQLRNDNRNNNYRNTNNTNTNGSGSTSPSNSYNPPSNTAPTNTASPSNTSPTIEESESEIDNDIDDDDDEENRYLTPSSGSGCASIFPCCSLLGRASKSTSSSKKTKTKSNNNSHGSNNVPEEEDSPEDSGGSNPDDDESVEVEFKTLDNDGTVNYSNARGKVIMEFGETLNDLVAEIKKQCSRSSDLYVDYLETGYGYNSKITKLRITRDGNKTLRSLGVAKSLSTVYLFKSAGSSVNIKAGIVGTSMKLDIKGLDGDGKSNYRYKKEVVIEPHATVADLAAEINSHGTTNWHIDHFEMGTHPSVYHKIRYENSALMATKLTEYVGLKNGRIYCYIGAQSIRGWGAGVIENVGGKCISLDVHLANRNGEKDYSNSNKKIVIELGATVADLQTEIRGRLKNAQNWNIAHFKLGYNGDVKKVKFDRCKDRTLESFGLKTDHDVFCTK